MSGEIQVVVRGSNIDIEIGTTLKDTGDHRVKIVYVKRRLIQLRLHQSYIDPEGELIQIYGGPGEHDVVGIG